jgi:uncharacterized membrane protein
MNNPACSRLPMARFRLLAPVPMLLSMALAAPSATAAELRGFASLGLKGLILFQPCEGGKLSTRTLKVEDATPDAALTAGIDDVRRIMLESDRPLYVEFRGDVAGLVATARQFQRALGTVANCDSAPTDIAAGTRAWASGEDPSWRFVLTPGGGQLVRPGLKPVRFPAAAFAELTKSSPARVVDAWSPQDGGSIRLELTEELCSDGRSESAFGARATLRYGSTTYEGCAARF